MTYRYIDIETYCNLDLTAVGLKNYIEHYSFEITLIGWVDVDQNTTMTMKEIENQFKQINTDKSNDWKEQFIEGFNNPDMIIVCHNVPFEKAAFEKVLNVKLDINKFRCTMTKCYQVGLPGALGKVSKALNLSYAKKDNTILLNYFAKPCRPTKVNFGRIRNLWHHDNYKWEEYCEYNKYDVLAMIELDTKVLCHFDVPQIEYDLWKLDHKLNSKGINVDVKLISSAVYYVLVNESKTKEKMELLTGLENPNSTTQLKTWLSMKCPEMAITSINKENIKIIYDNTHDAKVREVIQCRQILAKTSIKKYIAIDKIHREGKLYNLLQFAATGTGRWAGRAFQVHNLPKNKLGGNLDQIRNSYKNKTRPFTNDLSFELSQLLRTVIIPENDKTLLVCDYSSIEARVAAWVAGEQWVIDVFKNDGKIYEAMAAKMFGKDIEEITKDERADGKVAVLAGGYGGGYKAFQQFAPDWDDDKAKIMVDYFRDNNPNIVNVWSRIEKAAKYTIKNNATTRVNGLITFRMFKGCLLIGLPSGRNLHYVRARLRTETKENTVSRSGKLYTYEDIIFEHVNPLSKTWDVSNTYGGKLFENIVQAIARDILANALLTLDQKGHDILFHVHDEIITQIDNDCDENLEIAILKTRMCKLPDWADGLPINADGYACKYYMKEED
jgi:DNA polymerase bacteriophage-type